ncbi:MAG: dihydroneopterin aldolase [Burkholderiaceae bacterium]|nr:dihydroneopterin aldolase [Burkholderiaceae bacterium]
MSLRSTIELADLPIKVRIGVFPDSDHDPYEHWLDLTLVVDPTLVFVHEDGMQHVFDYDPLLAKIHAIAEKDSYETQEIVLSHIVRCCARFEQIQAVEICLKKSRSSRLGATAVGTIGVRLVVGSADLAALRA